jgi:hypothetical protein
MYYLSPTRNMLHLSLPPRIHLPSTPSITNQEAPHYAIFPSALLLPLLRSKYLSLDPVMEWYIFMLFPQRARADFRATQNHENIYNYVLQRVCIFG